MRHPTTVRGLEGEELADEFMKTTHGCQLAFYKRMAENYEQKSKADKVRDDKILQYWLRLASISLKRVSIVMQDLWRICRSRTNK